MIEKSMESIYVKYYDTYQEQRKADREVAKYYWEAQSVRIVL